MTFPLPVEEEDEVQEAEEMRFEQAIHDHFDALRMESAPPPALLHWLKEIPVEQASPQPLPRPATRPSEAGASGWWRWVGWGLVPVAAALLVVFGGRHWRSETKKPPHLVLKGTTVQLHLEFARKERRRRYKAKALQALYPGDLLQFVYTTQKPDRPRHLMIVAIDASGQMTVLAPFRGTRSIVLRGKRGTFPKGESLEVDRTPGKILFLGLLAPRAFEARELKAALHKARTRGASLTKLTPRGPWQVIWRQLVHKKAQPR